MILAVILANLFDDFRRGADGLAKLPEEFAKLRAQIGDMRGGVVQLAFSEGVWKGVVMTAIVAIVVFIFYHRNRWPPSPAAAFATC